jgi:ABC-type uncharacterized transport system auxiliary subunit
LEYRIDWPNFAPRPSKRPSKVKNNGLAVLLVERPVPTKALSSYSYHLKRRRALSMRTMNKSKLTAPVVLMTAVVSLAGCAGKIRYPSYYALDLPAPAPASAANQSAPAHGSAAVRQFDAPHFLRGGPIAYRESQDELGFYAYHRWAEDPRRVVTDAMVREMQARGLFQSVDVFDGRQSPDCLVTGTLEHLEEVDNSADVSIEVSLSAQLVNLRTGEVLWRDTSSITTKLDRRSVPGVVAEMSRNLEDAVQHLVSSMQDRLSAATSGSR